jgi:hypothetical protein
VKRRLCSVLKKEPPSLAHRREPVDVERPAQKPHTGTPLRMETPPQQLVVEFVNTPKGKREDRDAIDRSCDARASRSSRQSPWAQGLQK